MVDLEIIDASEHQGELQLLGNVLGNTINLLNLKFWFFLNNLFLSFILDLF